MNSSEKHKDINDDQEMLGLIKQELDKSCDRLDGATLSRLNKIRHDALGQRSIKRFQRLLLPGGLMTSCLIVVMFYFQITSAPESSSTTISPEDSEIWAASDSFEFYEDLEFYQWLAENDPAA